MTQIKDGLRRFEMIVGLAGLLLASLGYSRPAIGADADWKVFGATPGPGLDTIELYYDAGSVKVGSDGHVAVWAQGFSGDKLVDAIDNGPKSKTITDAGMKKLKSGYVLPFSRVQELDDEHYVTLVLEEVAVDIGAVKPEKRMLYEIDCPKAKMRQISITTFTSDGKISGSGGSMAWVDIPVASPGRFLSALVCVIK